jgi:uncharacterized protein YqhQ
MSTGNPIQIGGQAVIEGVMMRAPGMIATAVRRPDGRIVVQTSPFTSLGERIKTLRLPLLRGALGLVEMMMIGLRTLNFSAEVAVATEPEAVNGKGSSFRLGVTVAASLLIGVAVFFVGPILAATVLFDVEQNPLAFNLAAGMVRVTLLLTYLGVISLSRDIRRLFEYHGAEHKAVFAFERGGDLSVREAARQSRFHPRCGTSFLLIVMLCAILLFSVLDALMIQWLGALNLITRLLTHLPLIPLVGGVSYEFIRLSARYSHTIPGKIVIAPGLWLQRITTREPDESQLEVALVALRQALGREGEKQAENHLVLTFSQN